MAGTRSRRWVRPVGGLSLALFFAVAVSSAFFADQVIVVGPLTSFGLTGWMFLGATWCMIAALLGVVVGLEKDWAYWLGLGVASLPVIVTVVVTGVVAPALVEASTAPMIRIDSGTSAPDYLVRVGDSIDSSQLSLYRGQDHRFARVAGAWPNDVDHSRILEEYRVLRSAGVPTSLVYPAARGGWGQLQLPR